MRHTVICGPHTSLHWKQRTHKYMICCHIAHNNGRLIILIRDFSYEQYVLPDDDTRCAIETRRSILYIDYQLLCTDYYLFIKY